MSSPITGLPPGPLPTGALPAGPVPTALGAYSVDEPFDRALRIPLQTPEMSPEEEAVITGAVTTVTVVAGLGLIGRREDQ
jgi:hypothetical protein